MPHSSRSLLYLVMCIAAVAAAAGVGAYFQPGEWYAQLTKPAWTPPDWVFPPVWGALYLMLAISGWLVFSTPGMPAARWLWVLQLVLNALWPWLFFGLHRPGLALIDIVALMTCIGLLLILSLRPSRWAALLLAPYFAWVGYASALNTAIYLANTP